jgi:hypothetical protein
MQCTDCSEKRTDASPEEKTPARSSDPEQPQPPGPASPKACVPASKVSSHRVVRPFPLRAISRNLCVFISSPGERPLSNRSGQTTASPPSEKEKGVAVSLPRLRDDGRNLLVSGQYIVNTTSSEKATAIGTPRRWGCPSKHKTAVRLRVSFGGSRVPPLSPVRRPNTWYDSKLRYPDLTHPTGVAGCSLSVSRTVELHHTASVKSWAASRRKGRST